MAALWSLIHLMGVPTVPAWLDQQNIRPTGLHTPESSFCHPVYMYTTLGPSSSCVLSALYRSA